MLYLLDTDHLSFLERGGEEGARIQAKLRLLAPDDYGISIVTYMEQTKGWLAQVAKAQGVEAEVKAFGRLQQNLRVCTSFAIWEYTPQAAQQCDDFVTAKVRVGTQDLRIASIAMVNAATLLTRNTRDFSRVPGLLIEDWSI
jgi:tRNA(fMet)-specific endonuclease VapC